jgi:uncharacterized protein YcfJ
MRITLFAAAIAAVAVPTFPATAQSNPVEAHREYKDEVRQARHDYARDARNADTRKDLRDARKDYRRNVRDARKDYRQDVRDWRQWRSYDYNRYEPGQRTYYADRYYRDGRYYQPRRLTRYDRIYRGGNGRYYCRRSDGTTGLIIGGLAGGILGNSIADGGSKTLGTLLGGATGALLGRSIDRGNLVCR